MFWRDGWRAHNRDIKPDLIDANLGRARLIGANLLGANLSGADFDGSAVLDDLARVE